MKRPRSSSIALMVSLSLIACLLWSGAHLGQWLAAPGMAPKPEALRADLIVSLGGDAGARIETALALYKAGVAPFVLLTGKEGGSSAARAHVLEWREAMALADGVSRSAVLTDAVASNTWEEGLATRALMQQRGWTRVVVVSDPPHMRRVDWVWAKVFAGSGMSYRLVASEPAWWRPEAWWRDERSAAFVLMEVLKLGYYVGRYVF